MLTNEQFYTEVMSYEGMYPRLQLEKFYTYYTTKKPFSKIKGFTLERRLKTWFDPKRSKVFKEKMFKKNEGKTQTEINISILKNSLGKFNPLL